MQTLLFTIYATCTASLINWLVKTIYVNMTGKRKSFFWQNRSQSQLNSKFNFEEQKRKTKIVVIDKEEVFPVKHFNESGYSIEKWDFVRDFSKLESGYYDIIILDINGVAKDLSQEDGLGVIQSLKKSNPSQIIVSYSEHSSDISMQKVSQLVDEKIIKPSDFLKTKETIDKLIRKVSGNR